MISKKNHRKNISLEKNKNKMLWHEMMEIKFKLMDNLMLWQFHSCCSCYGPYECSQNLPMLYCKIKNYGIKLKQF